MCRAADSKRALTTLSLFLLLLSVILAACLLLPASPASATTLAQKKAAAKAKMAKVQEQLDHLNVSLERTIEQYNLANIKLDKAQKRVTKATRDLKLARLQLASARATLADRCVAIYKQGTTDVVDIAFSASSFADLTSVLHDWNQIAASDSQLVDNVENSVARVRTQRRECVAARAEATQYVAQVGEKKSSIESTISARQEIYQQEKATVRRIEKREAAIAAAAAERAAEAARAAAAAASTTASSGTTDSSGSSGDGGSSGGSGGTTPVATGAGHPEVIAIARHYLGVPYLYGGASPSTGFDCSGFVMYCYAQIGISLPHYSGSQQNMGSKVSMSALVPGDLVFKGYPVSYHVGMYAGNGTVIHSPHTGAVVCYTPLAGWQYAVRLP